MKLILVNLKFEKGSVSNFRRQEHLGIGYIGAACRAAGYDVQVINGQFEEIDDQGIESIIIQATPDVVGISVYEELLEETTALVRSIKRALTSVKIVVGGHYATFNCVNILKQIPEIDMVSLGEGEVSFPNLLHAIEAGSDLSSVKGICYREGELIRQTGVAELVCNLDELPYPLRSTVDRSHKITNISASRGCYGRCSFCSTYAFYKNGESSVIRTRNPVKVVDEMEYLVRHAHAYHLFFTDDNFMVNDLVSPGWIMQFVNEIKKRSLNIVFNFDCRVDDIDEELFAELKQVGLIGVFLGVESNSAATLELYNKGTSVETNKRAIDKLKKLRIDYWIGNIMFHPLTTLDDIESDITFFQDIRYYLYFNYSNPISCLAGKLKIYKGTDLFNSPKIKRELQVTDLICNYDIKDERVSWFYHFIQSWKEHLVPFVELDAIFLIEQANRLKQMELASNIHTVSRKYMRVDFEVFRDAHHFLKHNKPTNAEFTRFAAKLTCDGEEVLRKLYAELKQYYDEVHELLASPVT